MNNDDIIRLALAAGLERDGDNFFSKNYEEMDVHIDDLKMFAELARADEREECAKLCDSSIHDTYIVGETGAKHYARRECAAAIRARGNK